MPSSPAKLLYQTAFRIKHRPEMLVYGLEYYQANREHLLEKQKMYDARKQVKLIISNKAKNLFKVLPLGVF